MKFICLNGKIYLYTLGNVFVQFAKCICHKKVLQMRIVGCQGLHTRFWPKCKIYLSKLENVFVLFAKCICQKKVLQLREDVGLLDAKADGRGFGQSAKFICPN